MKQIRAIIQPHMLEEVMQVLHRLPHFNGATVSDCRGQGRGGGLNEPPPSERALDFAAKTKLEILCDDEHAESLIEVIRRAAHTGHPGDGIIMVADVSRMIRIRTGQEQNDAV